jgi:hypothetical protein
VWSDSHPPGPPALVIHGGLPGLFSATFGYGVISYFSRNGGCAIAFHSYPPAATVRPSSSFRSQPATWSPFARLCRANRFRTRRPSGALTTIVT